MSPEKKKKKRNKLKFGTATEMNRGIEITSIDQTYLINMFLSLMKSQCSGFSTANNDK